MPDKPLHPDPPFPALERSALLVDLYELTMLGAYHAQGMAEIATFELFFRKLPPSRNYLVAAGLELVLDWLEGFRFQDQELAWLRQNGRFDPAFVDQLSGVRFTGEVHAVPEGTIVFADEPVLRVTAPLPEAQVVETRLLNLLHFQTLIASKASRMVRAAQDRPVIDFGLRRAHGAEAGTLAARAAYLAGFEGTSNVLAAARFGIPAYGTMAHSFIQAHLDEAVAFEHFARTYPENATLLIDTYDTERGARIVAELSPKLAAQGVRVGAVRIDSGDLAAHARKVRAILDGAGLTEVRILASSGLEETQLAALVGSGAPIDGFAPGTHLVTSADAPYLDCAYKLVEYAGRPRFKRSESKVLWPGVKQVHRELDSRGRIARDRLVLAGDPAQGTPLLEPVMRHGRRLSPSPALSQVRAYAAAQAQTLPEALRQLSPATPPPLDVAAPIQALLNAN